MWTERTEVDGVPVKSLAYGYSWYERTDGAYVWWCNDQYWSNPLNPNCRMWIGYDARGNPLNKTKTGRRRTKFNTRRKWATAQAAMKAIDEEYPLGENISHDNARIFEAVS